MKVKIGNTWHDSRDEPVCIQIDQTEQEQIAGLDRSIAKQGKYASFPDNWGPPSAMLEWMETEDRASRKSE